MEKWTLLCWLSILLLLPYILTKDFASSNEANELIRYFRQQDDEGADESADFPGRQICNDTMNQSQQTNQTKTLSTLFPFLQSGYNETTFDTFIGGGSTNEVLEDDDVEYLNDFSNDETFLSPLEKLPVIGNLITGKGLEKLSRDQTEMGNQATKENDGFDVQIRNETSGDIRSLPKDAQMDLEDPLSIAQPELTSINENVKRNATIIDHKDKALTKKTSYEVHSNNKIPDNSTIKHKSMVEKLAPKIHILKTDSSFKDSVHLLHLKPTMSYQNNNTAPFHQIKSSANKNKMSQKTFTNYQSTVTKENGQMQVNYNKTKQDQNAPTLNTKQRQRNPQLNDEIVPKPTHRKLVDKQFNATHSLNQTYSSRTPNKNATSHMKPPVVHKPINLNHKNGMHPISATNTNKTIKTIHNHEITFKPTKPQISSKTKAKEDFRSTKTPTTPKQTKESSEGPAKVSPSNKTSSKNTNFVKKNKIVFVQLPQTENARCMDGSAPAYYIRNGYGDGKQNWIIHLHGGAWCYDLHTCSKRRSTILGSTKRSLDEDIGSFFHGVLSNEPDVNPHFYNWNTAVLIYCDGGLFSGNREKPLVGKGKRYFFQGRKVLKSQLDNIRETTDMPEGKQFILSGTSAGGLSLILQANYIKRFLPSQAKVRGLVDAGYFLDQGSIFNTSISNVQFKALYSLHRPTLSRACVENQPAGKRFKCLFPQETIKYVKIPLFLVNSLYDHWQLSYLEGVSCVYDDTKCGQAQHDVILGFRNKMYSALNQAFQEKNDTGVFANSCFGHGQVILDYTWSKSQINKKSISQAFYDWYKDDQMTSSKRHVNTDCKLPCNGSCPTVLANRCVKNFIRASPERRKRNAELC